ncbi:MAG: hypothetical protein LBF22_00320 [Deltaproteobacteria bacterium]|jgi:hypothetical protein|nr:hypothetical protein [Deltaproteobacteria bacterium]
MGKTGPINKALAELKPFLFFASLFPEGIQKIFKNYQWADARHPEYEII